MLEEFRKCTRNILAASVAVEGQVRGFAALCVCISKGRRDKAGTGAAGYTVSHDSAGKEINDGAKIYSRIFDLKIGDVTYQDLIWMIRGKLSLQQIPLPALLQLFSPNSTSSAALSRQFSFRLMFCRILLALSICPMLVTPALT